jgi:hypothetical protein
LNWLDWFIRNAIELDHQVHDLPDTELGKDVWLDYYKVKYPSGYIMNVCNIYSTSKKTGWDLPKEFNSYPEGDCHDQEEIQGLVPYDLR